MKKTNKKGYIFSGPEYSVMMKYSDDASKKKNIKFIPRQGRPFEISTENFVELLSKHVNFETLAPAFIHNKQINMVRVARGINFTPNRDIKAGETIQIPFQHMVPIEFAVAEEALGVAHIDERVKTINKKAFDRAMERVTKEVEEYAMEQYRALLKSQLESKNNPNSS